MHELVFVDMPAPKRVGGYVIRHERATDVVFFGPFFTYDEAVEWWRTVGRAHRVQMNIIPVVSPGADDFWNPLLEEDCP
jgi:hypothetical protein